MRFRKNLGSDVKKSEFKKVANVISGRDGERFTGLSGINGNDDNINTICNENEEKFPEVESYIKKYIQGGQSAYESFKEKHKESKGSAERAIIDKGKEDNDHLNSKIFITYYYFISYYFISYYFNRVINTRRLYK